MNLFNINECSTSESLEPPSLVKQRLKSKPQVNKPNKIHDPPLPIQEVAPQVPIKRQKSSLRSRPTPVVVVVDPHSIVLAGLLRTACEKKNQVQPLPRQIDYHREEAINDLKNRQLHGLTEKAYSFCCTMTENFVVEGKLDVSLADITHAIPEFGENSDWKSFQELVGCTDRNQFLWLLRAYKESAVDWSEKLPTDLIERIIYWLDLKSALNARLVNRRASDAIMFHKNTTTLRSFTQNELGDNYIELLSESEKVMSGRSSTNRRVLRFFGGIRNLLFDPSKPLDLRQIILTHLGGHRELAFHLLKKYGKITEPFVVFRDVNDFNNYLQEKVGEEKMTEFWWRSQDVILFGIFLYRMNRFDLLETILQFLVPINREEEVKEFMFHMLVDMAVVFPEEIVGKYWLIFLRGDKIFPASHYLYQDFDACAMYSEKVKRALERNFSIPPVPGYSRDEDYQARKRRVAWLGDVIFSNWSKFPWSSDNGELSRKATEYTREEKWFELVTMVLG